MIELFQIVKGKTSVKGFWKDESGKIFKDSIRIDQHIIGHEFDNAKGNLFNAGEKCIFYIFKGKAYIEYPNGQKQVLKSCITIKENHLKAGYIKALINQHGGLTVYRVNPLDKFNKQYLIEIWKE